MGGTHFSCYVVKNMSPEGVAVYANRCHMVTLGGANINEPRVTFLVTLDEGEDDAAAALL